MQAVHRYRDVSVVWQPLQSKAAPQWYGSYTYDKDEYAYRPLKAKKKIYI